MDEWTSGYWKSVKLMSGRADEREERGQRANERASECTGVRMSGKANEWESDRGNERKKQK